MAGKGGYDIRQFNCNKLKMKQLILIMVIPTQVCRGGLPLARELTLSRTFLAERAKKLS